MKSSPTPRLAACLHGFLRSGVSMLPLRVTLRRRGWAQVWCPTFRYEMAPLERHAERVGDELRRMSDANGGARVDLVTHSMGGLLARHLFNQDLPIGRVVMLAPPNQGAEMAAKVRRHLPVHRLGWDPLAPLLPGAPSGLALPSPHLEVGILTGGTGGGTGFSRLLDGDNDGKVRVAEAHLDGARELRVVPARHPFVMARPDMHALIVRFLTTGSFDEAGPQSPSAPAAETWPAPPQR